MKVVNVAELGDKNWIFLEEYLPNETLQWKHITGNPKNFFERTIKRPKLARYRANLEACKHLRDTPSSLVISHMPRMTHWQSKLMDALSIHRKHIAFSFNFTDLPTDRTVRSMTKSFKSIDKFVVYSQFEKTLYSKIFKIPENKFTMLHWAMEHPQTDPSFKPTNNKYYCAVGGEGRDYSTLIEAFRPLKHLTLIIVTRPSTLNTHNLPSNIKILYNLSKQQFWSTVAFSEAVVIPLDSETKACGHISIVGAMKLNRPIITTFSKGTTDYVEDGKTAIVTPWRDPVALSEAINTLDKQEELRSRIALSASQFAQENCNINNWANFVKEELQI